MDTKNKNLYAVLKVPNNSTGLVIKKAYYKLSKKYHPDLNKEPEAESIFKDLSQAYAILTDEEKRKEYDLRSKYGQNYDEYYEMFNINVDFSYEQEKDKLQHFKKNEVNNIQIHVGDDFGGVLEYERWVKCKICDGSGKDLSSKILIKDTEGNILKVFDSDDGCDFCDGIGKDQHQNPCYFCQGQGRVGLNPCKGCSGEKRILGKQKTSGIKLTGKETKIDTMGHFSKDGIVGYLLIIKN